MKNINIIYGLLIENVTVGGVGRKNSKFKSKIFDFEQKNMSLTNRYNKIASLTKNATIDK